MIIEYCHKLQERNNFVRPWSAPGLQSLVLFDRNEGIVKCLDNRLVQYRGVLWGAREKAVSVWKQDIANRSAQWLYTFEARSELSQYQIEPFILAFVHVTQFGLRYHLV